MKILVTGGAGFIGSHIVDRLIEKNHEVVILDNLSGNDGKLPDYLNAKAKLIKGDIRNKETLKNIISTCQVVFHTASSVGISQSNYVIRDFVENNSVGTATLLEAIVESDNKPKLILSSSNTSYGEGLYRCVDCGTFHPEIRNSSYVENEGFEFKCEKCGNLATPIPTPEETSLNCNSVYALTKKNQEELAMILGKLYDFSVISLRYFNVFGPRQSLSNPYTGVSAIFMNRVKNGNIPVIYEDGLQTRDFIFISDVVDANMMALEDGNLKQEIFNVGSGKPISIKKIAEEVFKLYSKKIELEINGSYRKGDIRHCVADSSKIKSKLNWKPKISFEEGLKIFHEWSLTQESTDEFEKANSELKEKNLV
jgi:dTDP-L-rhamnose 4-epimerase